jgi:hypothetical protein
MTTCLIGPHSIIYDINDAIDIVNIIMDKVDFYHLSEPGENEKRYYPENLKNLMESAYPMAYSSPSKLPRAGWES